MSDIEYNKGKLIPFGLVDEDRAKKVISASLHRQCKSYLEWLQDDPESFGLCIISGQFYQIEFEVEGGQMIDQFADVSVAENGVIAFSTQHYNGGGHWLEVVEGALKANHK